ALRALPAPRVEHAPRRLVGFGAGRFVARATIDVELDPPDPAALIQRAVAMARLAPRGSCYHCHGHVTPPRVWGCSAIALGAVRSGPRASSSSALAITHDGETRTRRRVRGRRRLE